MFEGRKGARTRNWRRRDPPGQVSDGIVFSCILAGGIIALLAGMEAWSRYGAGDGAGAVLYGILAALGVLLAGFIVLLNRKNRRIPSPYGKDPADGESHSRK